MAQRLAELGPQHYAAIRMRLEGRSTEKICAQLGIQPRTLYIWFSDPLVKAELTVQQRRINDLFAERLAALTSMAIEKLSELVNAPVQGAITPETQLRASREILDRAAPAPDPATELRRDLQSMSDEELKATARRLLEQT
jgi:AcrR family transcriptional regulator